MHLVTVFRHFDWSVLWSRHCSHEFTSFPGGRFFGLHVSCLNSLAPRALEIKIIHHADRKTSAVPWAKSDLRGSTTNSLIKSSSWYEYLYFCTDSPYRAIYVLCCLTLQLTSWWHVCNIIAIYNIRIHSTHKQPKLGIWWFSATRAGKTKCLVEEWPSFRRRFSTVLSSSNELADINFLSQQNDLLSTQSPAVRHTDMHATELNGWFLQSQYRNKKMTGMHWYSTQVLYKVLCSVRWPWHSPNKSFSSKFATVHNFQTHSSSHGSTIWKICQARKPVQAFATRTLIVNHG